MTAPSWAPVFPKIAAAVSDIGGMMSHAAIIAREYGLPAVVGTGHATKQIKTGTASASTATPGSSRSSTDVYVVPFRALGLDDVALVGGKCAHLGDLTQAGFPVPPGFAVTTDGFEVVLQRHLDELLAGIDPEDVPALEREAERVRAVVESLDVPPELADAIAGGYEQLADELGLDEPPVAVRSSAVAEDAADASFAGMQSTYLWLRGADEVLDGRAALLGELLQRGGALVPRPARRPAAG